MIWQSVQLVLFLAAVGYACYLFYQAVYHRYLYLKLGKSADLKLEARERLAAFLAQTFGQTKLLKDRKSGIMHVVIFYGFIILQLGALDLILLGLFGVRLPVPGFPLFELLQETTIVLVLLAMVYAVYRRYIEKVDRLKRGWKPSIVVFFICSLLLSVLFTLAFHRVREGAEASIFTPVTSLLAATFDGLSAHGAEIGFHIGWWAHLLILLAFLVYVPQSKHFHILTAPVNILLRRQETDHRLSSLNFEDEDVESYGVSRIEEFTRKQLLDLYACVECGRCTNVCPASNTGKLLSPMHLITKLRDHLTEKGAAITSRSPWVPAYMFGGSSYAHAMQPYELAAEWSGKGITDITPTLKTQQKSWQPFERPATELELIGDVITEDELWSCTTCRNCEDQCPVGNEHVDKIIDLRRYLVLTQGSMPPDGQRAIQNIERQGNPWGISRKERAAWVKEIDPEGKLHVPHVSENPQFEYLFFVGSMGSYDNRSRKVTRALVRLMNEAGVNFAILGSEEHNSGDTPRRIGNEYLFQQLCLENIETFRRYNVKKIVTACPHTYNILKNEYPEFGLEAEVIHHSELLAELVKSGKLKPRHPLRERVVYHDSCYLGRYNGVYEQPRDILLAIPGMELAEMERSRENGMCCGAGGGMMWMEETAGKRINLARTEQALAVNPTVISTACPYCLTMIEDGTKLKEVESRVKARDIAELLELAVFGEPVSHSVHGQT